MKDILDPRIFLLLSSLAEGVSIMARPLLGFVWASTTSFADWLSKGTWAGELLCPCGEGEVMHAGLLKGSPFPPNSLATSLVGSKMSSTGN